MPCGAAEVDGAGLEASVTVGEPVAHTVATVAVASTGFAVESFSLDRFGLAHLLGTAAGRRAR